MKSWPCSLFLLGALILAASPGARALSDGDAASGRLIARRLGDSVVGVKGSVIMRITLDERLLPSAERKIEINGTVVSPTGLTVVSYSAMDPAALFDNIRKQMAANGQSVEVGKSEFKNLRLQMEDGTEVPSRIVWKDMDQDLMLLAPDHAAGAGNRVFTFVDLNSVVDSASVLRTYFHLSRAGDAFKRVPLIRETTVVGIIERPHRLFLVSTDAILDTLGCPIFDPQGRVLGICLNDLDNGVNLGKVVVPASDLAAIIDKASSR